MISNEPTELHGAMSAVIDRFDYSATGLGPRAGWDPALRQTVQLLLEAPFPMIAMWGPENLIAGYNDAYRPLLGRKPLALGKSMTAVWAEAVDVIGPEIETARSGKAVYRRRAQFELDRGDGDAEEAWFNYSFSPIRDEAGQVRGVINVGQETTAEVVAEIDRETLNQELRHRVKNTLAIVTGLASLSFRDSDAAPRAVRRFQGRLQALAEAQDLLFENHGSEADLRDLALQTSAACGEGDRIELEGPQASLPGDVAGKVALILHELCTNALKYGALSAEGGRVALSWTTREHAGETLIDMIWRERGGPNVADTAHEGFGSHLIRRSLDNVPNAAIDLQLEPEGVLCAVTVPAV